MAKITIKPLSKNDLFFTKSFMTFSKSTNKRRNNENNNSKYKKFFITKKKKGKQLLFFEKIRDKNSSRDEIHENLIKVLKKNGFKIKNDPTEIIKKKDER